jgi:hypothetical protein
MWLDCTQETELLHSLALLKSALERYLKYRGWLADVALPPSHPPVAHRAVRGGAAEAIFGVVQPAGTWPSTSLLRARPGRPPRGFHVPHCCSELPTRQRVRIWRRSSLAKSPDRKWHTSRPAAR